MDIGDMRRDFESEGLDRDALDDNPVRQFKHWFEDAREAGILEPNAMSLGTTGSDGMPDLRTVLLKYFDDKGFVFYTNYGSRKAREMDENPRAALLFPWIGLNRQVCIQAEWKRSAKLNPCVTLPLAHGAARLVPGYPSKARSSPPGACWSRKWPS